jgi:hypothetical protein
LLLTNDKDFIGFIGYLENKKDYKKRLALELKSFSEEFDLVTFVKHMKSKRQIHYLYYILTIVYNEIPADN